MEYDYSESMTSSDAMALDNDSEMTPGMFFSVIFFFTILMSILRINYT